MKSFARFHADRCTNSVRLIVDERGRGSSLSTYATLSGRNTAATCGALDHPRLDCRLLHQDPFFIPECPDGIASCLKRLMTVVGHVAGFEGGLMYEVSVVLGPIFEKIDGICERDYLPNQAFPLLQIYGMIKVSVHSYLTENVGDQQGWRSDSAPAKNVFSLLFRFNRYRMKFFGEARP